MTNEMYEKMASGTGFIAALDQSGGSTPKALKAYGIPEDAYTNDDEMFDLVHEMRSRIITNEAFGATGSSAPSCSRARWTGRSRACRAPGTCGRRSRSCRS
jgi:hypothetical protein